MKRSSHNYINGYELDCAVAEHYEFLVETGELKPEQTYEDYMFEKKIERTGVKHLDALLLDSSLISTTGNKNYYLKVVDCGKYKQVYYYNNLKVKKDKQFEKYKNIDTTYLFKKENINKKNDKKYIETKNINRSKFKLERLIKANEEIFKTFITLTFEDEIIDIEKANKRFRYWRDLFQRHCKDFKYVCVPEFQKNGKVHYHMLTNIDYHDHFYINENMPYINLLDKIKKNKYKLIKYKVSKVVINKEIKLNDLNIVLRKQNNKWENTKKTYNHKSKSTKVFKTIKYWSNGFSNVSDMKDVNIVGYLTKYMTKEIDNRLFGKKRYLYSTSLIVPKEYYIGLDSEIEQKYLMSIINGSDITYKKTYLDKLENEINFIEYKLKDNKMYEVPFEEILELLQNKI